MIIERLRNNTFTDRPAEMPVLIYELRTNLPGEADEKRVRRLRGSRLPKFKGWHYRDQDGARKLKSLAADRADPSEPITFKLIVLAFNDYCPAESIDEVAEAIEAVVSKVG